MLSIKRRWKMLIAVISKVTRSSIASTEKVLGILENFIPFYVGKENDALVSEFSIATSCRLGVCFQCDGKKTNIIFIRIRLMFLQFDFQ